MTFEFIFSWLPAVRPFNYDRDASSIRLLFLLLLFCVPINFSRTSCLSLIASRGSWHDFRISNFIWTTVFTNLGNMKHGWFTQHFCLFCSDSNLLIQSNTARAYEDCIGGFSSSRRRLYAYNQNQRSVIYSRINITNNFLWPIYYPYFSSETQFRSLPFRFTSWRIWKAIFLASIRSYKSSSQSTHDQSRSLVRQSLPVAWFFIVSVPQLQNSLFSAFFFIKEDDLWKFL